jgi:hypothetical protein
MEQGLAPSGVELGPWGGLLQTVRAEIPEAIERTIQHTRTLRSYDSLPVEAIRALVTRSYETVLDGLDRRRRPTRTPTAASSTRTERHAAVKGSLYARCSPCGASGSRASTGWLVASLLPDRNTTRFCSSSSNSHSPGLISPCSTQPKDIVVVSWPRPGNSSTLRPTSCAESSRAPPARARYERRSAHSTSTRTVVTTLSASVRSRRSTWR